jgi:hypothetical protein
MDAETAKWFASLGVGGALAVMMFLMHRKDVQGHVDSLTKLITQADDRHERDEQERREMRAVVKENTVVIAHNTDVSRAMVDAVNRIAPDVPQRWKGR